MAARDDPPEECGHCGAFARFGWEPDPCLGVLPGVDAACCGHGKREGYISFEDGLIVCTPNPPHHERWRQGHYGYPEMSESVVDLSRIKRVDGNLRG